jgi:hypothetical protein
MTPINSYSGLLDAVAAARERANLGEKRRQERNPQKQSHGDLPEDEVPQEPLAQDDGPPEQATASANDAPTPESASAPDNGDEPAISHLDIRA